MRVIKYIFIALMVFPLPFSCEKEKVEPETPGVCDQSIPLVIDEIIDIKPSEVFEDTIIINPDSISFDRLMIEVTFSLEDKLLTENSFSLFNRAIAHPCGDHYLEERPQLTGITVDKNLNGELTESMNLSQFFSTSIKFNSTIIDKTSIIIEPINEQEIDTGSYIFKFEFETSGGHTFKTQTDPINLY